jgi:hypothetical protein
MVFAFFAGITKGNGWFRSLGSSTFCLKLVVQPRWGRSLEMRTGSLSWIGFFIDYEGYCTPN